MSGRALVIGLAAIAVLAGAIMVVFEPWQREPAGAASGLFERTWGKDVDAVAPGNGFEICTVAADCKIGAATTGLGGEFAGPRGAATDSAGNVYVADSANRRIVKFDSIGNFQRAWGRNVIQEGAPGDTAADGFEVCTVESDCRGADPGTLGGEFSSTVGVAVDGANNVYATDLNRRVQKFDSSGNFQRAWGKDVVQGGGSGDTGTGFEVCTNPAQCQGGAAPGGLGGEMNEPTGLAADSAGNVYVADEQNHRIQRFDSSGNFQRTWGRNVIQEGMTGDTAADGFEVCTVASACQVGSTGRFGGELNTPDGVAVDSSGKVFVVDGNHRAQRFDSSGTWERAWGKDVIENGAPTDTGTGFEICTVASECQTGTPGGLGGEMFGPIGVAVDGAGNVYVAEFASQRIQRFDSSGNFHRAWGRDVVQGGGPGDTGTGFEVCTVAAACKGGVVGALGGEMNAPEGLATDASGDLYVAERNNNRIQLFTEFPSTPTPPATVPPATTTTTTAGPTGQRAAALKKCKKKKTAKKRKKCRKRAQRLPL